MSAPSAAPSAAAPASPSPVFRSSTNSSTQWDRCLENGAIKAVYGGVLGTIAAAVLFRS
jgi:hypothetical protein